MTTFCYCGPSGGLGGVFFNDGQVTGLEVAEVRIWSGVFIDSIQIIYTHYGTVTRPRHGGSGGNLSVFKLTPGEYITEVGGKYGWYIDSLWIKTNQGKIKKWGEVVVA